MTNKRILECKKINAEDLHSSELHSIFTYNLAIFLQSCLNITFASLLLTFGPSDALSTSYTIAAHLSSTNNSL